MKTAVITGASDGLGLELSKQLLKKRWRVIGISRSKPKLKGIKYFKADLTKSDDIDAISKELKKSFPFDCLINCAGIIDIQKFGQITYDNLENLFRINVLAPIQLTSNLFDVIKKNEADIVNIGSTIGYKAYKDHCAYGTSKWALRGFSEHLREELSGTPSRVISFNPGKFKTNLIEKATGKKIDLTPFMDTNKLAAFIIQILELPKNMEVSEIIINRK